VQIPSHALSVTSEVWELWKCGADTGALNMARDEALLETVGVSGSPVLRFYAWSEPAATFGYSQRYQQVANWTHLRPLIRRPTGGGVVPHDADWTYTLVFPPDHPWYQLPAAESYRCAHEWLRRAFALLGVQSELAPSEQKEVQGRCFIGAEKFDLLLAGVKVAGAAQRRNGLGLLIQGSVQPRSSKWNREQWEEAMMSAGPPISTPTWRSFAPQPSYQARVQALWAEKYSQASYHERR
jgi:lipoate-protein ligase A